MVWGRVLVLSALGMEAVAEGGFGAVFTRRPSR